MNRREFVKMAPAFPAAAITATMTLNEQGKEPIDLDLSVLTLESGDTIVLKCADYLTQEAADRIKSYFEYTFEERGIKAMVLDKGMSIEGVLRA